jgi:succinoglycan biosynthesis protein ExoA
MPSVSIIVPCYNEKENIRKLLEAIYAQTFPRSDLEVVIADGMSTDGTRAEISTFAGSHPNLKIIVVDNLHRHIPAGLNCALKTSRGEFIVRLDAHSLPYPNYVERCVSDLQASLGENVGGVWEIHPATQTWLAQSIAIAAAHPLGVGDALYRHTTRPALVDTVPFGAFKRELMSQVGYFDETLLTNEDYEFNARLRKSGGRIWLDPTIRSVYIARGNLSALARQYFRYGYWKWRMLLRYPTTLRWRQGLPPLFILVIITLATLGIFFLQFRLLLVAIVTAYLITLVAVGIQTAVRKKHWFLILGLLLAIACMHISWGTGFLWSIIKGVFTIQTSENK